MKTHTCRRCEGTFERALGGYCSDACLRLELTFDEQDTWDRMPATERDRVHVCADSGALDIHQAVTLWFASVHGGSVRSAAADEAAEQSQDLLDERLVERTRLGEYGKAAIECLKECEAQHVLGASRRSLLRAFRRALQVVRAGGRPRAQQAPLPLAAGKDPRLP